MALSLREAAEQTGSSKSTIWRAIRAGRLSATRLDGGGFAIDPAELFRVFEPKQPAERPTGQDATPATPGVASAERPATDEIALKLAAAEAKIAGLEALLDEVKTNRDDLLKDRDEWRSRAPLALPPPDQRRAWWRRLAG